MKNDNIKVYNIENSDYGQKDIYVGDFNHDEENIHFENQDHYYCESVHIDYDSFQNNDRKYIYRSNGHHHKREGQEEVVHKEVYQKCTDLENVYFIGENVLFF